ncbi:hypothetical protein [Stenoxybacter acetivorans]|nr:hypothetical protein [Stenoxybacter acetivorans]
MPDTQSCAVEIVQITDMHLGANKNSLLKNVNNPANSYKKAA